MKSNDVIIVGAGMAGLLAARMLKHRNPIIIEKANSLPNNHSAVLRFRSSIVGDTLGIPFKKVRMIKTAVHDGNIVAASMNYAFKCSGVYRSDRSLPVGTESGDRFIAPTNLIERMAEGLDIKYSTDFNEVKDSGKVIISTIPMPVLMSKMNYVGNPIEFNSVNGANITVTVPDCDAYVSVYDGRVGSPISRVSVTGDKMIIEIPRVDYDDCFYQLSDPNFVDAVVTDAAKLVGFGSLRGCEVYMTRQKYAKIQPADKEARQSFIHWATDRHRIFSLGRFATWRPNVLLDDLVNDIRLIDKWSSRSSGYEVLNHRR